MNFKLLRELFRLRDLRNLLLGVIVVGGGLGLAALTLWANYNGEVKLAGIAAGVSIVFVLLILIFIVPPLARSASTEASQINLPFEFTLGGALIFALIAIVGFSAWNTGNNLLFLVLSFLASSLVVGFFTGNYCLKKLDVKMRFPETIFAGEPTPIQVSLQNRKRLFPTFSVVAEVRGKERENSPLVEEMKKILPARLAEKLARPPIIKHTLDYFVHVPRKDSVESRAEHVFPNRGRFIIKDFELSTKFPFGFFRHRRRLAAQETEIVIFPRIAPVEEELKDLPLEVGKLVANRRGVGQDLLALRDYQPMDDLRRVDWKATARANRLIIREFSAEDDKRVAVIFDARLLPDEQEKKKTLRDRIEEEQKGKRTSPASGRFETGVGKAASLLAFFTEEQAEICLIIDGETSEYGVGREHLHECLKRLATIEPNFVEHLETTDFSDKLAVILEEKHDSHNFLISTVGENVISGEYAEDLNLIKY
ncbi:MAG TPA: DUF58 domain-containing protein [Pyrinomonadaceae bacterium]|nr:DUF58 domain-containing protein [Pyrinomonadaceae bacterium]